MTVLIDAPSCNSPVNTYSLSGDLPQGLKFDTITGVIYGLATTPHAAERYNINASPYIPRGNRKSEDISFTLSVEEPTELPIGLNVRITPDGYCGSIKDVMEMWNAFDNNEIPISYEGVMSYVWGQCSSVTCDWDNYQNFGHRMNFCMKIKGFLNVEREAEYEISLEADDTAYLFLGSFDSPLISNVSYIDDRVTKTVKLTRGAHRFGVLYQQGLGPFHLKVEWKSPEAGIYNFVRIPKQSYSFEPSPVQHVHYDGDYLTFIVGYRRTFSPVYKGHPTWFTLLSDLPKGLVFLPENGTITGIPTEVENFRKIEIKVVSGTTSSAKVSISIQVVNADETRFRNNLYRRVYKPYEYQCNKVPNVNDGLHLLLNQNLESTINYPINSDPFGTIFADENGTYVMRWSGYLKTPLKGHYLFRLGSVDGSYLKVDNKELNNMGCSIGDTIRSNTTGVDLPNGYVPFELIYLHAYKHDTYGIEVYWTVPDSMDEIMIPPSNLFHIPNTIMEYSSRYSNYVLRGEIEPNNVIFHSPLAPQDFSNFYVYPMLPRGLGINSLTGAITGNPISSSMQQTKYYVSASSDKLQMTIGAVIQIETRAGMAPSLFNYLVNGTVVNRLTGKVGVKIDTLTPSVFGEDLHFDIVEGSLPIGVVLDRVTGIISGTPTSDTFGTLVVQAGNNLGTTPNYLEVFIQACDQGKKYVMFNVMAHDPQVKIQITGEKNASHEITKYGESYGYGECLNLDSSFKVHIDSKAPRAPYFYLRLQNHTYLQSRRMQEFSEVLDYNVDFEIKKPKITFSDEVLTFYTHTYGEYYGTIIGGVQKASITPALPSGLVFSQPATISGLSRTLTSKSSHIITYSNENGTSTTNITIDVINCDGNNIPFEIVVKTDELAYKMTVQLTNKETKKLVADFNGFNDYSVNSYTFCNPAGNYNLKIYSTDGTSWKAGARVTVFFAEGLPLFNERYRSGDQTDYDIDLNHLIPIYHVWKYYEGAGELSEDWRTVSFDDSKWKQSETGFFPLREKTTSYYRAKFDFKNSLTAVNSLLSLFKYDAGIIIYLNGKELYRNNLPLNGVTSNTKATKMMAAIKYYRLGFNPKYLKSGVNILAVELHIHQLSSLVNPFGAYFDAAEQEYSATHLNSMFNGLVSVEDKERGGYPVSNLFDKVPTTQWIAEIGQKIGTSFTYTYYDNRIEYINSYVITAGDSSGRDPKSWSLYGSNDNFKEEEVLLDDQYSQYFYQRQATYGYYFNNERSFNAYKWVIETHGDIIGSVFSAIQVADFLFYSTTKKFCPKDKSWRSAAANSTVVIPCPKGYRNELKRECKADATWGPIPDVSSNCVLKAPEKIITESFDITIPRNIQVNKITFICDALNVVYSLNDKLPHDLVFNPEGFITGHAIDVLTRKQYNLTASNDRGSISQIFYLQVEIVFCPDDYPWLETEAGMFFDIGCKEGQTGVYRRYCFPIAKPYWKDPENTCVDIPPKKSLSKGVIVGIVVGVLAVPVVIVIIYYIAKRKRYSKRNAFKTLVERDSDSL